MCDIYSVGIILYEIYSRSDPYHGEDFRDTLRKVCDRRVNKRPGVPSTCPPKFADLMKKCWSPDPSFRPSAKDLDTQLLDISMRDAELLTDEEQEAARRERTKGDMLYELFPKHVADQLKAGQKVEPESHDEVTVVFSDIVVSGRCSVAFFFFFFFSPDGDDRCCAFDSRNRFLGLDFVHRSTLPISLAPCHP